MYSEAKYLRAFYKRWKFQSLWALSQSAIKRLHSCPLWYWLFRFYDVSNYSVRMLILAVQNSFRINRTWNLLLDATCIIKVYFVVVMSRKTCIIALSYTKCSGASREVRYLNRVSTILMQTGIRHSHLCIPLDIPHNVFYVLWHRHFANNCAVSSLESPSKTPDTA